MEQSFDGNWVLIQFISPTLSMNLFQNGANANRRPSWGDYRMRLIVFWVFYSHRTCTFFECVNFSAMIINHQKKKRGSEVNPKILMPVNYIEGSWVVSFRKKSSLLVAFNCLLSGRVYYAITYFCSSWLDLVQSRWYHIITNELGSPCPKLWSLIVNWCHSEMMSSAIWLLFEALKLNVCE